MFDEDDTQFIGISLPKANNNKKQILPVYSMKECLAFSYEAKTVGTSPLVSIKTDFSHRRCQQKTVLKPKERRQSLTRSEDEVF